MSKLDIDFLDILRKADAEIGTSNVLIAGKTGVGKSTLINAVFAGNMAKVGKGEPVTQSTQRYTKESIPLAIYDSRGLELAEYEKTLSELEVLISSLGRNDDPSKHIHCGWICINESAGRWEKGELALADLFKRQGIPHIIVLTKCDEDDPEFAREVRSAFPTASQVIETMAEAKRIRGGSLVPPFGLAELVEATIEVIPEGQRAAFAAAQKVNKAQKRSAAKKIVAAAAVAAAAAAGLNPVPVSDWVVIVPIQIIMLAKISRIFGFDVTDTFLMTLIKGSVGSGAATILGLQIMASLLKFIPGVGTAVGGALAAGTSASVTTALGLTYVKTVALMKGDPEEISPEDLANAFRTAMKNPVRKDTDDVE